MPILAVNKKATFDYEILETYEAGIVLQGQEVKSAKLGQISLKGAFVTFKQGELYLTNCHISQYQMAGKLAGYDPIRPRKLLVRKRELMSLIGKTQQKGLTLIPLKLYTKHSLIKLEFALAKGKKKIDKRETIKRRETDREIRRQFRNEKKF
ncbi:MAG: SsrA-binding protein SmpB [Parcubacteria group bacterium]|nr:SsrA-binding protein SmpB [Parcubacteria group bacterium]